MPPVDLGGMNVCSQCATSAFNRPRIPILWVASAANAKRPCPSPTVCLCVILCDPREGRLPATRSGGVAAFRYVKVLH
jgi:hypothetical protein